MVKYFYASPKELTNALHNEIGFKPIADLFLMLLSVLCIVLHMKIINNPIFTLFFLTSLISVHEKNANVIMQIL